MPCKGKKTKVTGSLRKQMKKLAKKPVKVSLPTSGNSWTDWSHTWGGEMRLRRALEKLNLEYPRDSDD